MTSSDLLSFNQAYVETDRIESIENSTNGNDGGNNSNNDQLNQTTHKLMLGTSVYDDSAKNNKFNSFPMRQKKSITGVNWGAGGGKLKSAPLSTSSIQQHRTQIEQHQCINLSQGELSLTVRIARNRRQEADRLKHLIRNNCWPANHPIRKYLWKCLLAASVSSPISSGGSPPASHNKENNNTKFEFNANELEYNKHLNQIFGKRKFL